MVPSFCNSKFLAIILFVTTIACNYFDQFFFCSKLQSTVKIVTFSSVENPTKVSKNGTFVWQLYRTYHGLAVHSYHISSCIKCKYYRHTNQLKIL